MQWLLLPQYLLARHIIDFYRDFRVNTIFTNDIAVALDHINRDPVQLIIIDDSVKEANARQGMSKKRNEDIGNFLEIRHVYENVARVKTGVVIVIYLTQRFKLLDVVFRSGHEVIFKSTTTDTQDVKLMKSYMTDRAYDELGKLTYRMFMQHDNTAKGDSIVTIPISGEEKTCGRFHLDYIKPFLRKVNEQLTDGAQFYFNREGALDALMKDKVWKKKAKAFFISLTYPDLTQAEIGKKVGYTSHDQVSKVIKSVRGELSRIGGEEYEKFKTAELIARGFDAQRLGGVGEPDIVARNRNNGIDYVFSCKCLDFDRNYKLEIHGDQGISPEVDHALNPVNRSPALILCVFNLKNRKEREFPLDPVHLSDAIELTADLEMVE